MYIYTFLLRMTDTMTSLNIDISSWDTCIACKYINRSGASVTVHPSAYQEDKALLEWRVSEFSVLTPSNEQHSVYVS
jgi:hypothetical protein